MGDVRGKAAFNKNNSNGTNATGGRYGKLDKGKPNTAITWAQVDGPTLKACVGFVTGCGDAITLGRTTDGGALSVTILSGADRLKKYATTPAEAKQLLDDIIEACGPDL
jgi:hypothetical protein